MKKNKIFYGAVRKKLTFVSTDKTARKMLYPIGIQDFEKIRRDSYVYVDKTDRVYKMAKRGGYCFLSRPRRFVEDITSGNVEMLKLMGQKGYDWPFVADDRKVFKIGANFSTKNRRLEGWKVAE